jgi:hypothetical protein
LARSLRASVKCRGSSPYNSSAMSSNATRTWCH